MSSMVTSSLICIATIPNSFEFESRPIRMTKRPFGSVVQNFISGSFMSVSRWWLKQLSTLSEGCHFQWLNCYKNRITGTLRYQMLRYSMLKYSIRIPNVSIERFDVQSGRKLKLCMWMRSPGGIFYKDGTISARRTDILKQILVSYASLCNNHYYVTPMATASA